MKIGICVWCVIFSGGVAACGDGSGATPTPDAASGPQRDAHVDPRPVDAAESPTPDAGPSDTGTIRDTGPILDTGSMADSAANAPDLAVADEAGPPFPDASSPPPPDAESPEADAVAPPPPDAAPVPDGCASGVETCNGLDDNCDGQIDNDVVAPRADRQFGVCAGATRVCLGEAGFGEPDYAALPDYEFFETRCDGLDNDCDGAADVGLLAPPATYAVGLCVGLTQLCAGEIGFIDPDPGPLPAYEFDELSCDGLDNDCDGETDETLPDVPALQQSGVCAGALQICGGGDGMIEPDYTALPDYESFETRCDGLDNDCDGLIDDDLSAPPAGVVAGVCAGQVQRCDGAQGFVEPDYAATTTGFEATEATCDGLDNDCDGETDEALAPPLAGLQEGACAGQVQRCGGIDGWLEPDYAALAPGYEAPEASCDGLDNDCDGEIDGALTAPAAEVTAGVCVDQVQRCAGVDGWLEPDYTVVTGHQTVEFACDGLDNDCDGVVDAGAPSADRQITRDAAASTSAALAFDGLGHGLAFLDARSGAEAVWFARLDPEGVALAPETRLTPDAAAPKEPAIAFSGEAFAIVYRDTRGGARGELWLTLLDREGAPLGPERRILPAAANLASVGNPRIVWTGAEFGVVYSVGPDINGLSSVNLLRLAPDGLPVAAPTVVSGLPNLVVPGAPSVAFGAGGYGIVWHDARAGNVEIYFARADPEGLKLGNTDLRVTNAARSSGQPRIAWNGEHFGVAFSDGRDGFVDMYFARVSPGGVELGAESRITHTQIVDNFQFLRSALVALDGGRFGLVSADTRGDLTGVNGELWLSLIGPDGLPLGPEARVTDAPGLSTLPAVSFTGDTLGVAFTDDRSGNPEIHFARNPFGCR